MKNYVIAFFPDGQIMGKENLCSCHEYLDENLDKCEFEPGRIINKGDVNSEDDKTDGSEYEGNEIPKELFFPISKKVQTLAYIHHLKPVNCFIFVKF